ncbi:MAG: hypothetical protein Q8M22_13280 [Actinomycetota bacterium]|nr:hypothetical protein [Actinomycetota bacterium]
MRNAVTARSAIALADRAAVEHRELADQLAGAGDAHGGLAAVELGHEQPHQSGAHEVHTARVLALQEQHAAAPERHLARAGSETSARRRTDRLEVRAVRGEP